MGRQSQKNVLGSVEFKCTHLPVVIGFRHSQLTAPPMAAGISRSVAGSRASWSAKGDRQLVNLALASTGKVQKQMRDTRQPTVWWNR